jgi:hypothetical protein
LAWLSLIARPPLPVLPASVEDLMRLRFKTDGLDIECETFAIENDA